MTTVNMDVTQERKTVLLILFVLGFSAVISQVVLFREFLIAFGGNEFVIGIFLSTWMVINGAGAFSGRFLHAREGDIRSALYILLGMAFLPLIQLFLLDFLHGKIFPDGIQASAVQLYISSLVMLFPFCFVSGLAFSRLGRLLNLYSMQGSGAGAYSAESAGSMAGGALFSLVLAYFVDNFQAACIVAVINSLVVAYAARNSLPRLWRGISLLLSIAALMSFLFLPLTLHIRHFLYGNQEMVNSQDTPFGNLTVTRLAGQLNFYQNNLLLFTTENNQSAEEAVHFAMVQHPHPASVLLVSGGISGMTSEILKYPEVQRIDYLELDPFIFRLAGRYTKTLLSGKVHTFDRDVRYFLKKNPSEYDVILLNLPEPSTLELNRYYTREFFRLLREQLSDSGIIGFSLPPAGNYLNEDAVRLHSSVYLSCREYFSEIRIYSGSRTYYVASDTGLGYDIGRLAGTRGLENDFVNSYYLDETLLEQQAELVLNALDMTVEPNADFRPVAMYGLLRYWSGQFRFRISALIIPLLVLFLALIISLFFFNPALPGMFGAGFSLSSLQVLLTILFQIEVGQLYQSLGIFVAICMGGLSLGAAIHSKVMDQSSPARYALLQVMLAILSFSIPTLVKVISSSTVSSLLLQIVFFMMIFSAALLTGFIFASSLQLAGTDVNKSLVTVYTMDMAGAACGALVTTLLIIPWVGIMNSVYAMGLISLVLAVNSAVRRKTSPV